VIARSPPVRSLVPGPPWPRDGAGRSVAFGKLMKINHPAPGDVVSNPAQVAGYGTAFEGVISVRIRDETTGP
jgi:Immunoglobulin-like domain of bacterial spore germination